MNIYLITFGCYPSRKIIANNIVEAINKYQKHCIEKNLDCDARLNNMTSIKYVEGFDYIN